MIQRGGVIKGSCGPDIQSSIHWSERLNMTPAGTFDPVWGEHTACWMLWGSHTSRPLVAVGCNQRAWSVRTILTEAGRTTYCASCRLLLISHAGLMVLYTVAEVVIVMLLVMPMPSNKIRGNIQSKPACCHSQRLTQPTVWTRARGERGIASCFLHSSTGTR